MAIDYHWCRCLTHWGRVTQICVSKPTIIGSDNGLSPGRRQDIIYLNQCWNFVYWTLGNKFQRKLNPNSYIFKQENAFENVVWERAAILARSQCVNSSRHGDVFMRQQTAPLSIKTMACQFGAKPSFKLLKIFFIALMGTFLMIFESNFRQFIWRKIYRHLDIICKIFASASMS